MDFFTTPLIYSAMCVNLKTFNESFRQWSEDREDETLSGWPIAYSLPDPASEVVSDTKEVTPISEVKVPYPNASESR
jgi:hypothetical protein